MKKRFWLRLVLFALCIMQFTATVAAKTSLGEIQWLEPGLEPMRYFPETDTLFVKFYDGWGVLKLSSGELLVPCGSKPDLDIEAPISDFRDDLEHPGPFPVFDEKTGKTGFMNSLGEVVGETKYLAYEPFQEQRAVVCEYAGGEFRFGFLDASGQEIVPLEYDDCLSFSEGLAAVCKDGKVGFINTDGELVIPMQYDYDDSNFHASDYYFFSEGLAGVCVRDETGEMKFGFIDKTGKTVVEPIYDGARFFSDGMAAVFECDASGNTRAGFVNTDGALVIPLQLEAPFEHYYKPDAVSYLFQDGCAWMERHVAGEPSYTWDYYLINASGEVVSSGYEKVEAFSEGLAAVCPDADKNQWGFVNSRGEQVAPAQYWPVRPYQDGMARVRDTVSGACGFLDQTGAEAIPPQYDAAWDFTDGVALVADNRFVYLIDHSGKKLLTLDEDVGVVGNGMDYGAVGGGLYAVSGRSAEDFQYGLLNVSRKAGDSSLRGWVFPIVCLLLAAVLFCFRRRFGHLLHTAAVRVSSAVSFTGLSKDTVPKAAPAAETIQSETGGIATETTKKGYVKPIAALIALAPCLYCILFGKWLSVTLLYQSSSATLWRIGKLLKNVADLAAEYGMDEISGPMTAATLLTYTLLIVTLGLMFLTIRSILAAFQSGDKVSTAGFWGAMALSGVVLILAWMTNGSINEETDGWLDEVFHLGTAPYLTLFCAAAGCVCCKYLPEQAFANVELPKMDLPRVDLPKVNLTGVEQSVQAAAEKVSAAISRPSASAQTGEACAFCGKRVPVRDYQFCPYCGKERIRKRFCEECGKELELTMQFCPYCGTAVRKDTL